MKIRESEEMYLETILVLKQKGGQVRSVDIVDALSYAKSSVSRAVNLLEQKGFIKIGGGGEIELTEPGREKAQYIYKRHRVLTKALVAIGVDASEAEENACRVEHVVSDRAFAAIERHLCSHLTDHNELKS